MNKPANSFDEYVNIIINSDMIPTNVEMTQEMLDEDWRSNLAAGALGLSMLGSPVAAASLTRGIENNNPGNIIAAPNYEKWQGAVGKDGRFIKFDTAENGIRAMSKLLYNYYTRYKLNTVRKIINKWAPPVENNVQSYVSHIQKETGFSPDQVIDLTDSTTLKKLVTAIIEFENNNYNYPDATINKGIARAGLPTINTQKPATAIAAVKKQQIPQDKNRLTPVQIASMMPKKFKEI